MTYKGILVGIAASAAVLSAGMAVSQTSGQGGGKGPGCDGPRHERPSFQELDTNGDGEVTKDEMQARMAARFAEADTNNDGKLSLEELQAKARAKADERVAKMMARYDADGDGFLSADEMPKPKRKGGLDKMFDRADTDKSGGISEGEFDAMGEHMRKHGSKKGGKMGDGMKKQKGGNCGPDQG